MERERDRDRNENEPQRRGEPHNQPVDPGEWPNRGGNEGREQDQDHMRRQDTHQPKKK